MEAVGNSSDLERRKLIDGTLRKPAGGMWSLPEQNTKTSLRVQLTSLAALKLSSSKILDMTYLHIRQENQRKTHMSVLLPL